MNNSGYKCHLAKQTRKKIFQKKNEKSDSRHRFLKFSGKSIPLELLRPSQEKTQYLRYYSLLGIFPFSFFLSLFLSFSFCFSLPSSSFLPSSFVPLSSSSPFLPPFILPFPPSLSFSLTHSLLIYILIIQSKMPIAAQGQPFSHYSKSSQLFHDINYFK